VPSTAEFDEFVVTRSPRLLRAAYLLTRDWAAAEDLLQTGLAKAWFAWSRLDNQPEAYVRKIMFNTYASWWRRRSFREHPTAEFGEHPAADRHAEVDARDEVWRALGRLPRRQRAVLVLRYFEDLSEAEIAETLGISAGTVKSQAAKALAKLRQDSSLRPGTDLSEVWA
jgi:RNA polymerase sigma-70 factor (sigma-E family)